MRGPGDTMYFVKHVSMWVSPNHQFHILKFSSISHFEIFIPRRLYEDSLIRFLFSIKTPLKSTRYSSRINFAVDCPMDFHKFPFDKQVVIAKEIMTRMTMMMLLQVCQVKMTSFSQPAKVPSLS